MESLNKAIQIIGTQCQLASILEVSAMTVSQWKKRRVPAEYAIPIERATNGQVTRHELRPDIYPLPETQQSA